MKNIKYLILPLMLLSMCSCDTGSNTSNNTNKNNNIIDNKDNFVAPYKQKNVRKWQSNISKPR